MPVDSFSVYGSDVDGGPYTLLASGITSPRTFSETGVSVNHTRFYVVTHDNDCGPSAYSVQVKATIIAPPTGLTAVGNDNGFITLSWQAPSVPAGLSIIGYNVYIIDPVTHKPLFVKYSATAGTNDYYTSWDRSYTYYVTTLTSDGGESGPSNLATGHYNERGVLSMERGTVFQGVQIGLETTAGTAVPATKRLLTLQADPVPMIPIKTYKPQGSKAITATQQGKENTEARFSGIWDFNLLTYLFASMLGNPGAPTAIGATGAYQWNFVGRTIVPDSPQTYTVEVGSSLGASKFTYGVVTDMTLSSAKEDASIDGTMMGQTLLDNITMTPSVPELAPAAVAPKGVRISMGTAANSLTQLRKVISSQIRLNGHWKPAFFQDDSFSSFSGLVEASPDFGGQIVVELGSESQLFLNGMRGDILYYVQILVNGGTISAGTYTGQVTEPTTAPTLANATTGGFLSPGTYSIDYTYISATGETVASTAGTIVVPAGTNTNAVTVTGVTVPGGATGINVYASLSTGTPVLAGTSATNVFVLTQLPALGAPSAPVANTTGTITGAVSYQLVMTLPVKVTRNTREDHDSIYGATYDLTNAYDSTFGLIQVGIINKLATL